VGVGVNVGVNVFLGVGVGVGVAVGIGCAQQSATPVRVVDRYVSPLKQLVRLAQVNPVPQAGSVGVGVGVAVGIGCAQQSATPVPGCRQYVSPLKQLVRLAQVNPVTQQAGALGVAVGVGVFAVPPQELGTVCTGIVALDCIRPWCVDEQEPARQHVTRLWRITRTISAAFSTVLGYPDAA